MIKRCDHSDLVSLRKCNYRGVNYPEWKVEILFGEAGDTVPLRVEHRLDDEFSVRNRTDERKFGMSTDPVREQGADLGNDQSWNEERPLGTRKQLDATTVVTITPSRRGVKRSCVHNKHYSEGLRRRATALPTSSSTRSEASIGPPSPMAKKPNRPVGAGSGT